MQSRRREFLAAAAGLGLGGLGGAAATLLAAPPKLLPFRKTDPPPAPAAATGDSEEPNTPPESLMLEHAVQERLLGVYEEVAGRLQSQEDARAAGLLHQAAALVRKFYEDFHQRLEEQYVFPHFENHAQLGPLVKTLKAQHAALRAMTDKILEATGNRPPAAGALPAEGARSELAQACRKTVRLCRPHMAREATDLFQALYDAVPAATLNQLSEVFEKKQEEVFGDDPLQNILAEVAGIEKELGLLDLSRLTP